MSNNKENHPTNKTQTPMDRRTADCKDDMKTTRNQQNSSDVNRNEEKNRPSGQHDNKNDLTQRQEDRDRATERSSSLTQRSDQKSNQDQNSGRNQTTGGNTPGAEIRDRNSNQYGEEQNNLQQRREQRGTSGSSERTGQQYSDVGKNSPSGQNERGMNPSLNKKDHGKQNQNSDLPHGGE